MTYSVVRIRKGCWEARVYLGSYVVEGRRVPRRRKKRFPTRREAVAWAQEQLGRPEKEKTLTEYFALYLERCEVRPATRDSYRSAFRCLTPFFGALRPSQVREDDFTRFRLSHPDLKPITLHQYLVMLAIVMRWCGCAPPRQKQLPPVHHTVLTLAEQKRLVGATSGALRRAVVLGLFGGLRRGEVLALRWSDVQGSRVRVERSRYRGIVTGTKSHRARTVTMPAAAMHLLGEREVDESTEVVGLDATTFTQRYAQLCRDLKLPTTRFHDLRHTHATMLSHLNPRIIQERLGHSDVRTTLSIYTEVLPSMEELAARELDTIWTPVPADHPRATLLSY